MSVPITFVALLVSGSWTERGTDGKRRLVEHDLAAGDGLADPLVALDVALDQLDVDAQAADVGAPAGGEVVEHADLVAVLEQMRREMRADEAGRHL